MLCPANVLGHLLTTRLVLTGAPHVEFGKLPHSHSGRRAVKRSVIPSAVSRAFAFARSAGTRSRGISLRFHRRQHFHLNREPLIRFCSSRDRVY
jgi:hypothetical protein